MYSGCMLDNEYRINDFSNIGIPFTEVCGDKFTYHDLYELVGRKQYMTTFNFKIDSAAYTQYGECVTGVIYYDPKTLKKLSGSFLSNANIDIKTLKIGAPSNDLSIEDQSDLKYGGVKISELESISFLPYQREIERHDTGEKKVPNIINIEMDCSGIDPDRLCQSYILKKNNDGVELFPYEKEQLVGITLAINDGHIDSRFLKHLGFSVDSVKDNMNIWYHLYKTKERRGTLSDEEKVKYSDIISIRNMKRFTKFLKEIGLSQVNEQEVKTKGDVLKEIIDSTISFTPSVLLHGQKQIYWDVDSYIHIAMRHVKEYQLGNSKEKSPLPYKAEDLKTVIEKVLGHIKDEYKAHLLEHSDSNFSRHGRMAVAFNGDHYHLTVAPDGRLTQFHNAE